MSLDEDKIKVHATLVFEAIGRPPEYVKQALQNVINLIEKENGVKMVSSKIHETRELEKEKGFFSTFSEVEVEVEEMMHLAILVFKYMPAHIEIVTPEKISMTNHGWGDIFNEIARRLHGYDEVARVVQNERAVLERKLKDLMEKKETDEKTDIKDVESKKTSSKPKIKKK